MAFVAREREVSALLAELDRVCAGQGRVVVIAGEPGSGKSVLLRRFVERAEEHAARPHVVLARCYAGDDATPFAPWHHLTSSYPTLESRLPQPLGAAEPAVQGVVELGRRAAAVLVEAAAESPLILAFEDIDLADESSLALVRALAQRVASAPLLLILTVNAPHPHASSIAGWLNTIVGETNSTVQELPPIQADDIERFVDGSFSGESPAARQRLRHTLARLSGGNLLVLNTLIEAHETGEIDLTSDDDGAERLPTSLGSVVAALSARLPQAAMDILGLAAVVGEEIDLDMLATLRSTSPNEIAEHLDAALAMGLLIEDIDGTIRFRHGAFQRALARQQPPLRRRLVHAAILDWLRDQPDSRASAIARHAERSGDHATAYAALLDAAAEARGEFGFPEAAKLYQKALLIAERLRIPDVEEDNVRLAMADVLVWNDRARGIREIDRVATRARLRGDALMLARSAQRRATMLYEDADVSGCLTILIEVIPILRAHGDDEPLAEALSYAGYCYGSTSRFSELEKVAQELLEFGERTATPLYQAVALQFMSSLRVARGQPDDALGLTIQSIDIAEELGRYDLATDYAAVAVMRIGLIANLHEPARMKALLARGEELARLRSTRLVVPDTPEPAFVFARFSYGEWDMVRTLMPTLLALIDQSPQAVRDIIRNLAAELAFAEGRVTAAERELDKIALAPEAGSGDHSFQHWLTAVSLRVQLCLAMRDIDRAVEWADAIERHLAEREFAPGYLTLGIARGRIALAGGDYRTARTIAVSQQERARATNHQLALIRAFLLEAEALRAANDGAEAVRAADAAAALAHYCQLPYEEARARVQLARGLLASGEAAAAEKQLTDARLIFTQLGATAGLREIESLMTGARPARPAGLTEREVDVLRLVSQGLSDRQIADQLFISHRTVTTHVGNLLGKTQTANRTELAIWALRHDISGPGDPDPH
ncbi:MAG TPA: DUF2791 family P-loop domain-containing protein [Thermomicrobiales bacterium]|nr:DUF2791 family P-loop domain-containing protein [Thermomicrobiales bacterium]